MKVEQALDRRLLLDDSPGPLAPNTKTRFGEMDYNKDNENRHYSNFHSRFTFLLVLITGSLIALRASGRLQTLCRGPIRTGPLPSHVSECFIRVLDFTGIRATGY